MPGVPHAQPLHGELLRQVRRIVGFLRFIRPVGKTKTPAANRWRHPFRLLPGILFYWGPFNFLVMK